MVLASTQACTDLAVATPSGTGTVDVTLNQSGSARGYMGIELTKAPIAPGTYYVWVESLDQAYRVREGSQLVGLTADDEYRGGFEICTVMGGEILDENFQKVQDLSVDQPTQAFLRVIDPTQALDTFDVSLTTLDRQERNPLERRERPGVEDRVVTRVHWTTGIYPARLPGVHGQRKGHFGDSSGHLRTPAIGRVRTQLRSDLSRGCGVDRPRTASPTKTRNSVA